MNVPGCSKPLLFGRGCAIRSERDLVPTQSFHAMNQPIRQTG